MKLRKRRNIWYLDYTDAHGKRHQVSTGTKDKRLAETIASKKHTDNVQRKAGYKIPDKIFFEEFKSIFLDHCEASKKKNTIRFHKNSMIALEKEFGGLLLSEITPFRIEEFVMKRVKEVSKTTVNRELATLNHLYNLAVKWNKAIENPTREVAKLKEPPGRNRYLSIQEVSDLLKACHLNYLKIAVQIALNTGLRKGEIIALTRQNIDLDNRIISVEESKSGKRRDIPINDSLFVDLKEYLDKLEGDVLIPVKDFRKAFNYAKDRADLSNLKFHDLRHTFASYLAMAGVGLATLKELMGHSTIQMTMRYAHLSPDHRVSAVNQLTGKFGILPDKDREEGNNQDKSSGEINGS